MGISCVLVCSSSFEDLQLKLCKHMVFTESIIFLSAQSKEMEIIAKGVFCWNRLLGFYRGVGLGLVIFFLFLISFRLGKTFL